MLNTLKTIKNLGILLLHKYDNKKSSIKNPKANLFEFGFKKGSIAYQIDNFIDRGSVTMSDDLANALDAMKKAKVISYSFSGNYLLIFAHIDLLREYVYATNGDLINIFNSTNLSQMKRDRSIPIGLFNYLFGCDPLKISIYSDDELQVGYSLLKLSEIYNSVVFFKGKEDLITRIEGAIDYLLEDGASTYLNPTMLDKDLKYFERHKVIDVAPSIIIIDTFRFYEWFSIQKNKLGVQTAIDRYNEETNEFGF